MTFSELVFKLTLDAVYENMKVKNLKLFDALKSWSNRTNEALAVPDCWGIERYENLKKKIMS